MKWYSTKKYKPALSNVYLVKEKETAYLKICSCDYMTNGTYEFICLSTCETVIGEYFCDIPPIEIEE